MALSVTSMMLITLAVLMVHKVHTQELKITVSDAVKRAYDEIVVAKTHRYAIFYLRDMEIEVEKLADRNASYDQFVSDIQKDGYYDCRFGLFGHDTKPFIIYWCPDSARIKTKLEYTLGFNTLKMAMPDVKSTLAAQSAEELVLENVEGRLYIH